MIKLILVCFAISLFIYALFAFAIDELNPFYWNMESRIGLIFVSFALSALCLVVLDPFKIFTNK